MLLEGLDLKIENLDKLKKWCEDNELKFISWDGRVHSSFYYTPISGELSGYTYSRNAKFTISKKTSKTKRLTNYSMMTDDSKERYIKNSLSTFHASAIEMATNPNEEISFFIKEGDFSGLYGKVKVSSLINITEKFNVFTTLDSDSKEVYCDKVAKKRGYNILEYPTGFSKKCILMSPKGNEWEVQWNSFDKTGYNCPSDSENEKLSHGEKMIKAILKRNGIDFEMQKTIKYEDERYQYMDFYVKHRGQKYCIEYNGIQHYEEVRYFKNNSLNDINGRDLRKYNYCKDNNIKFIEIPYTMNTVILIYNELAKYIGLNSVPSSREAFSETYIDYNEIDIVEYYKHHTQKETAKKFNISIPTVCNISARHGYKKRVWSGGVKIKAVNVLTGERITFENMKIASQQLGFDVKNIFKTKNPSKPRKNWVVSKVAV